MAFFDPADELEGFFQLSKDAAKGVHLLQTEVRHVLLELVLTWRPQSRDALFANFPRRFAIASSRVVSSMLAGTICLCFSLPMCLPSLLYTEIHETVKDCQEGTGRDAQNGLCHFRPIDGTGTDPNILCCAELVPFGLSVEILAAVQGTRGKP